MVHVPTPNPPDIPDLAAMRCGVQRQTMRTNVLIHRAGLSEVNKMTFTHPGPDKVFGVPKMADPEGARDVTSVWKCHEANPNDVPGPDFRAMNKRAAVAGVTKARDQLLFRTQHPASLRSGEAVRKAPPQLPSDVDPAFTYGVPGTYRSAEQVRNAGPADPPTKPLIQNQYATAWIRMNAARAATFDRNSTYIPPRGTVATRGHWLGAEAALARAHGRLPQSATATFKLSKFKHATPKVFDKLNGSSAPLGSYRAAEEAARAAQGPETVAQAAADIPAPVTEAVAA